MSDSRGVRILELDPGAYRRHAIHGEGRTWAETNCYTDVLIEQLHALGHEPVAALPYTLRCSFEGDQWTFFKFPHADLEALYGLDVEELAVWRPLVRHVEEQVRLGRPVLVELDSFFLPDTAGSAYRLAHVKSTVSVNELDVEARKMGYFHGQGYYRLEGQDFADVFQLEGLAHERLLPPYFEYMKRDHERRAASPGELLDGSLQLLRRHFAMAPRSNPFRAFRERFGRDLEWLMKEPIETFHAYSFATLRQYGACFELSETYFRWLASQGRTEFGSVADAFKSVSDGAKAFQFQLARAMARKRPLELAPLDAMAGHWGQAMSLLSECRM
jgi:hypothetical protein